MNYKPHGNTDIQYRLTAGIYQQPNRYREIRLNSGALQPNVPAQCSYQATGSVDWNLRLWDMPFRFTADIYYKYITHLVPYTIDNMRVRYNPDQEAAAKEAGADHVGLDEYIEKIKGGWTDVDVIITMPSCMGKLGPLGRVLGPRGLMPNPKSGTVTMDVAKAVKEVKQGKIDFKVDKAGIIHTSIGKVTMTPDQLFGNAKEFIATVIKLKPAAAKGTYIKSIFISSTMSKGIKVDPKSVE